MTEGRAGPDPSGASAARSVDVGVPITDDVLTTPVDATVLIGGLASSLARLHDGTTLAPGSSGLEVLRVDDVLDRAAARVKGGEVADAGGPVFGRLSPERVVEALRSAAEDVAGRCSESVVTIGRATFANLEWRRPTAPATTSDDELSGMPNLTFRRSVGGRSHTTGSDDVSFRDWGDAALADPYRDLGVATASVVEVFGPGAVLGLMDAYAAARPAVEPLDLVRLDWWSTAATLTGLGSTGRDPASAS